jgi:DNA-binding IclR family transcriptional regulator
MRTRTTPYAGTQAVRRALSILKAFTESRSEWPLTELATHLGMNKTTTFRLLDALQHEGLIARDPKTGLFRLGPTLVALGTQALRSMSLSDIAHGELTALTDATGETASLEVLAGDDVIVTDQVYGRYLTAGGSEVGMRFPAHATSTGKVLLAAARDADPKGFSLKSGLPRLTPKTIRTATALKAELERVSRRGYATAVEELESGYVAVAAPVRDLSGRVVAAVSVGGPSARFTIVRVRELVPQVREAARRISQKLGAPNL